MNARSPSANKSFSSVAIALAFVFGAAVTGFVLAAAAQVVMTVPDALSIDAPELTRLALLRDLLLRAVLPAAAMAAFGRLLVREVVPSTVLVRLSHLALGGGAVGLACLLAGAVLRSGVDLVVIAIGLALILGATALEAIALLVSSTSLRSSSTMAPAAARVAALGALATLPLAAALLALTVSEHFTGRSLWRGVGGDLAAFERAIRDCAAPLLSLALVVALGVLLDAIATAARRTFFALTSSRVALWALVMLGIACWSGQLGELSGRSAAVRSFFALSLLVPAVVLLGNTLATLALGRLDRTAISWSALAAMVLILERAAIGIPLGLADLQIVLRDAGLAAAATELELTALGFALVSAALRMNASISLGAGELRLSGLIAFVGVQVAFAARLASAQLPRGFIGLPRLQVAEAVASLGLLLGLAAATLLVFEVARGLRTARGTVATT